MHPVFRIKFAVLERNERFDEPFFAAIECDNALAVCVKCLQRIFLVDRHICAYINLSNLKVDLPNAGVVAVQTNIVPQQLVWSFQ